MYLCMCVLFVYLPTSRYMIVGFTKQQELCLQSLDCSAVMVGHGHCWMRRNLVRDSCKSNGQMQLFNAINPLKKWGEVFWRKKCGNSRKLDVFGGTDFGGTSVFRPLLCDAEYHLNYPTDSFWSFFPPFVLFSASLFLCFSLLFASLLVPFSASLLLYFSMLFCFSACPLFCFPTSLLFPVFFPRLLNSPKNTM